MIIDLLLKGYYYNPTSEFQYAEDMDIVEIEQESYRRYRAEEWALTKCYYLLKERHEKNQKPFSRSE